MKIKEYNGLGHKYMIKLEGIQHIDSGSGFFWGKEKGI
jgi:hypothetical protein